MAFFHVCFSCLLLSEDFLHSQAIPLQHPGRAYPHSHTVSIINSMPIPVQISPLPAIIRHTYGKENIQVNPITTKAMPHNIQVRAAAPNAAIKEISTKTRQSAEIKSHWQMQSEAVMHI